jgi:hypothetical protein
MVAVLYEVLSNEKDLIIEKDYSLLLTFNMVFVVYTMPQQCINNNHIIYKGHCVSTYYAAMAGSYYALCLIPLK